MQPDQEKIRPDYDFILNSKQQKKGLNLGSDSFTKRLIIAVGGFFILLIIFIVIKGILSGGSPGTTDYYSLLQDQSEIIHIINTDLQNQNIPINSANLAFSQTALLSMTSYQSSLVKYMKNNGLSVNTSNLSASSSSIDKQFSSALSSNDINSIFQSVMSQQLVTYNADITKAFSNTSGSVGKNLLQSQYKGTQLLIRELNVQYS